MPGVAKSVWKSSGSEKLSRLSKKSKFVKCAILLAIHSLSQSLCFLILTFLLEKWHKWRPHKLTVLRLSEDKCHLYLDKMQGLNPGRARAKKQWQKWSVKNYFMNEMFFCQMAWCGTMKRVEISISLQSFLIETAAQVECFHQTMLAKYQNFIQVCACVVLL